MGIPGDEDTFEKKYTFIFLQTFLFPITFMCLLISDRELGWK